MKRIVSLRNLVFLLWLQMLLLPLAGAGEPLPDFTELVQKYGPSVVNISTTQKIEQRSPDFPHGQMPDIPEDSPFYDFFRRFFGDQGDGGEGGIEEFDARSLGSGFIIAGDGYILTNQHVVKGADEIIVRLSDRREFKAKVIGSDSRSDIAVLKIDATGLPAVKIGSPEKLKVGEWVLAIGSPFGCDHSATAGIVSAKGRSLPSDNYVPFIQTDVAINPGNSGGPLFNMSGEVVGINSQIYSRTGGFMGLSFSIPIDIAMDAAEQLKESGHVSRGWLGILIQDVTRELADSFGMDKPTGALVARVLPDSPAEDAGLEVGDIVTEFDHHPIPNSAALPPMVGRTAQDKTVVVKVLRNGKTREIKVKLGELPEDETAALSSRGGPASVHSLGIEVLDLTDEQRDRMEIEKNGVFVDRVKPGAAHDAGLSRGDVILKINGKDVTSVKQFKELVDELPPDKSVPVLVQRRGGPLFLALKIAKD